MKYDYSNLFKLLDQHGVKLQDSGISDISIHKIHKGIALTIDQTQILCNLLSCSPGDILKRSEKENIYEAYYYDYMDGDYSQWRKNNTVYFALASLMFDQCSSVQVTCKHNGMEKQIFYGTVPDVIHLFGQCRCFHSSVKSGILNITIGNYS